MVLQYRGFIGLGRWLYTTLYVWEAVELRHPRTFILKLAHCTIRSDVPKNASGKMHRVPFGEFFYKTKLLVKLAWRLKYMWSTKFISISLLNLSLLFLHFEVTWWLWFLILVTKHMNYDIDKVELSALYDKMVELRIIGFVLKLLISARTHKDVLDNVYLVGLQVITWTLKYRLLLGERLSNPGPSSLSLSSSPCCVWVDGIESFWILVFVKFHPSFPFFFCFKTSKGKEWTCL